MKKGEYTELILKAKENEDELQKLLNLFEPLIKAYSKKLFFMEYEDARQEMCLAIVEAIRRIGECKSDGQSLVYINNAVKYKYAFLCRQSIHRKEAEEAYILEGYARTIFHEKYEDIVTMCDLQKEKLLLPIKHQKILDYIINGYSDKEISKMMGVSRQYINRIKKGFIQPLKNHK